MRFEPGVGVRLKHRFYTVFTIEGAENAGRCACLSAIRLLYASMHCPTSMAPNVFLFMPLGHASTTRIFGNAAEIT